MTGKTEKRGRETYYEVEFIETGYKKFCKKHSIKKGSIRDPYHRYIFGVACVGEINVNSGITNILFGRWYNMLGRCYDHNNKNFCHYGAKGVSVADEWLIFENYFNDVTQMDSYIEDKVVNGELVLDKDIINRESKKYSKETCIWTSWIANQEEMNSQRKEIQKDIIAISPNGDEILIYNIKKFADEKGLDRSCISKVLKKKRAQHNGWKFKYKEELK